MNGRFHLVSGKLRASAAQLRLLPRALALVWSATPQWTAGSAALLIAQGLLPLATVYLTRTLVDGIVRAVRAGGAWESVRPALIAAALMAGVALLSEALRSAAGWVRANQTELVQDHIMALVHRKSAEVDLSFYDSPEFFDRLHRARIEASYRPVALVETVGSFLQNGITLAAMLAVLLSFGPWVPLALALGTLPALWAVLRYAILQHELWLRTTADERRTWYYDWLLTAREAAPELRHFSLGGHFQTAYQTLRGRLRGERIALARGNAAAELVAGTLALGVTGSSLAWMLWRALRGAVSLGNLALFYQAFQQGLRLTRSLLDNAGQLYYNSLFLGNLFEFLALEPKLSSPPDPRPMPPLRPHSIRFENVTFRYPGSARPTLRRFSLTVPAGRIVALLGPNGAGKSSLIKLLCRFYDPDEGRIELDGADLRELSIGDLRRRIAVLFQEPVRYNATVAENIALGNAAAPPDTAAITSAARAASADEVIASLPLGYSNLLGKAFLDGAELSTGEWQRIALARAFLRNAPVLILDEPTSAMDPWAEADFMGRFRALAAGRTAILITHRLTTAMRADTIHVVSEGEVVESGTHDELLVRGGLYAQSWLEQTALRAAVGVQQ